MKIIDKPIKNASTDELIRLSFLNNINCFKTMLAMPNVIMDESIEGLIGVRSNRNSHLFNMYFQSHKINEMTKESIQELVNSFDSKVPFCIELSESIHKNVHELILSFSPKRITQNTQIYFDAHNSNIEYMPGTDLRLINISSDKEFKNWLNCFEKVWPGFGDITKCFEEWISYYGFGYDKAFQNFVCLEKDQPVGIASIHYDSGVAGPFNIAVIPEKQKSGIGYFIVSDLLKRATDKGYRYFVGSGSDEGMKLYKKVKIEVLGKSVRYFFN